MGIKGRRRRCLISCDHSALITFSVRLLFPLSPFFLFLRSLHPILLTPSLFYLSLTHSIQTMPPAMASSHLERSLYVVAPKFEKDSSSHTITFRPGHGWAAEFWWVTLTWIDHDKLRVATCWTCSSCHTSIKFQSMRIIPRSNFLQVSATVMLESKVVNVNGYDSYSAQGETFWPFSSFRGCNLVV